jgi:hypothetical protein
MSPSKVGQTDVEATGPMPRIVVGLNGLRDALAAIRLPLDQNAFLVSGRFPGNDHQRRPFCASTSSRQPEAGRSRRSFPLKSGLGAVHR